MYKNKFLGPASKVSFVFNDTPSNSIYCAEFQYHDIIPTAKYIFKDSSGGMPIIKKIKTLPSIINHSNIIK